MTSRDVLVIDLGPRYAETCLNNNYDMTSAPASNIAQPLTSSMFMTLDAEKAATSLPTMFVLSPDEEDVMEVPVPVSVAETGKIPDGFSVGMAHSICDLSHNDGCIRLARGSTHGHRWTGCKRHHNHRVCIQFPLYCPIKKLRLVWSHLSPELFEEIKGILNSPDNVRIVPTCVYEEVCKFRPLIVHLNPSQCI